MSEIARTVQQKRPALAQSDTFSVGVNKNSVAKLYFDQVSSKALPDPFAKHYRAENGMQIVKPPLNPYALVKILQENSHMLQNIDAMVTNIHGFGYRMEHISKDEDETSPAALQELQYVEEFFDNPNTYMSFSDIRHRLGWDYWALGNAYIEVGRDSRNKVQVFHHIPSPTMRMTKVDTIGVTVKESLQRMGKPIVVSTVKYFRRFVQLDEQGRRVYFKEFGDPRTIDPKTGEENTALAQENSATEIIHFAQYNAQSPYGIPIWHSQLPSILGSRQAELTNLDFFENNGVPAMAILVAGGYLTEEAFEELRDNFEAVKGRGSVNKILILEARGATEDASTTGQVPTPSITMKSLYSDRQNDALFQEYEKESRDKIRSVFRLPPVFTGVATDYTYASAKVSLEIAENQIFIPERVKFDDIVNKKLLATWELKFWRFRSNPAALATSEDLINAVKVFNEAGAISPNSAINIFNEKLNLDIPRIKHFWGDIPYQMMTSILLGRGGSDTVNYAVDMFKALHEDDVQSLQHVPVPVGTPGGGGNGQPAR